MAWLLDFPLGKNRAAGQGRVRALAEARFVVQADGGDEHEGDDETKPKLKPKLKPKAKLMRERANDVASTENGVRRERRPEPQQLGAGTGVSEMDEVRRVGYRGCEEAAMSGDLE